MSASPGSISSLMNARTLSRSSSTYPGIVNSIDIVATSGFRFRQNCYRETLRAVKRRKKRRIPQGAKGEVRIRTILREPDLTADGQGIAPSGGCPRAADGARSLHSGRDGRRMQGAFVSSRPEAAGAEGSRRVRAPQPQHLTQN